MKKNNQSLIQFVNNKFKILSKLKMKRKKNYPNSIKML
jgi:hypothetical protein